MNLNQADHGLAVRLKAALLAMIGSFILFTAYLALPPLGVFSGMLAPFPAGYTRLLHGRLPALIVVMGTAAAVTPLFGFFAASLYLGLCGTIGLLLPELLARGQSGSRALSWTVTAAMAALVVGVVMYGGISGHDLRQAISGEISSSMTLAASLYEKNGIKGEDLELVRKTMKTAAELLQRTYPALVAAMIIAVAGCNLVLLGKTAGKAGAKLNIGEFAQFKNPDVLVWLLITAGFAMLAPSPLITTPALNVLLIVSLLYFLQGMAVLTTIISRQAISGILRIVLFVMLMVQPYLVALVAGIGLCDLWVDFRTPKNTQENL